EHEAPSAVGRQFGGLEKGHVRGLAAVVVVDFDHRPGKAGGTARRLAPAFRRMTQIDNPADVERGQLLQIGRTGRGLVPRTEESPAEQTAPRRLGVSSGVTEVVEGVKAVQAVVHDRLHSRGAGPPPPRLGSSQVLAQTLSRPWAKPELT